MRRQICPLNKKNDVRWAVLLYFNYPLTLFLKFGGFFNVLFSGSNLSAHAMQIWFIHSISGNGRKPDKKIPPYATLLLTMKPEVESPLNRICISYNRRGHRAFAVFLLSFFIGIRRKAISAVGCRSPPSPSGLVLRLLNSNLLDLSVKKQRRQKPA